MNCMGFIVCNWKNLLHLSTTQCCESYFCHHILRIPNLPSQVSFVSVEVSTSDVAEHNSGACQRDNFDAMHRQVVTSTCIVVSGHERDDVHLSVFIQL